MLNPFRGFYDAQSEVDRLFDEMFGGLSRSQGRRGGPAACPMGAGRGRAHQGWGSGDPRRASGRQAARC